MPAVPAPPATTLPSPTPTAPAPPDPPVTGRATGLKIPWCVLPLPDGSALVDERNTGRILRVPADGGPPTLLTTIPDIATDTASGGLLGLARSPHYRRDHLVYAYVSTSTDNRVVRFSTDDPAHTITPVFTGIPTEHQHNGGALAFGPDGMLYIGTGDGGKRIRPQDLASLNGKVLRVTPDGQVPPDNPYGTAVWSIGHRNVEGFAFDHRGRLWESELGDAKWDEVNRIVRGGNGGWPLREGHVAGPKPDYPAGPGTMREPEIVWATKDASPSGVTVLHDTLYVTALRGEGLWRIPIRRHGLGAPAKQFAGVYGRLRAVAPAPGGDLWLGTTNLDHPGSERPGDDRLLRVHLRGR
ncbi:PQQ-dependent sugar dehydrogenase [Patulibacter minatonensis]|uniref:PQQ-dependent sugar dehydrogenase n=1 Tax=Patulibacter minatonensis TaxID=298163 RepID=UPI0009FD4345|nr:PQQ-dependent sugar dehydrogenase [Patulibacter minatonensis]